MKTRTEILSKSFYITLFCVGLLVLLFGNMSVQAQINPEILEPVKWEFEANFENQENAEVIFKAKIDPGWHMYSQFLESDEGPVATSFHYDDTTLYQLVGITEESTPIATHDPVFDMELKYFDGYATFNQKIKFNGEGVVVKGFLEFMVCNAEKCLPPDIVEFSIPVGNVQVEEVAQEGAVGSVIPCEENPYIICNVDLNAPVNSCGEVRENDQSIFTILLLGILGGFIALLTPCVFPMIPLTVSFFTKDEGSKTKGIGRSVTYGFFILLIYFLLSVPFHLMPDIDPEILNQISTNPWLNISFFVIFIVFAISFFGYFELVLPAKWSSKVDGASDIGGIVGTFLMALTLAIVSFSCTGPILGTLLAGTLSSEGAGVISILGMDLQLVAVKLTAGMTGFGLALGLPFAVFAAFPSMMNKLPKSGGWLNSIKVVLGFLEIALAIKFLSNADLVEQWGLLKRETFFAIWLITSVLLGLYLIGKLRFPHDSPINKLSPIRIGFAALAFGFAVYLFPGMIGSSAWNHNMLSGFPPPRYYSFAKKHHEIKVYTDYQEGLAAAKAEGKPIMLDFTGWACVNCRKMEDNVWVVEDVKRVLNEDYIVISLYVDERLKLTEEQQETVDVPTANGGTKKKKILRVGDKWATMETLTFGSNSQPYYVLLNSDEKLLTNPIGYNYASDLERFKEYLNCGLEAFTKTKEEPSNNSMYQITF